ncbi:MAG: response regulator [uncultured Solirubrobacteraceae bacterium]|uniref:Response regulator n=1 Tax=uncultured Solirubrobacteraceae bacterium TaxID=1162706 RepID=A0A6J4SE86_9ACTN|nr:MAG: response regulator [uncultured Solirubrobacteraceae bacterium]
MVKTHAVVGARILSGGGSELLETAEAVARSHHERWDGTGYPDGLAGDDIPLVGRLVAVADVFDVLVHERPYKEEWSVPDAAEEIRRGAGTQFDPQVVEAFDALGERGWTSRPR